MNNFSSAPAFGFETATCNAEKYYFEKKSGSMPNLMVAMKELDNNKKYAKTAWKASNVVKVLGYIPLLGTFLGIRRIIDAATSTKDEMPNRYNHISRGCIELLSLGFLLIIPDLILTGYREYNAKKNPVYLWKSRSLIL